MGPSGCGKSTLEKQLLFESDVYRVTSMTTRDKRDDEVDGVAYHFVSPEYFDAALRSGNFLQTTEFANSKYGTTYEEYTTEHPIAVLSIVPKSAVDFIPLLETTFPDADIKIVYFDIDVKRLRENMIARNESEQVVDARIAQDDIVDQFANSGLSPDLVLTADDLTSTIGEYVRKELNI